jgi:K+-sensing histidine kinase KdpD
VSGEATEARIGASGKGPAEEPASTRPWAVGYGAAAVAVMLALLFQILLIPLFGARPNASPFMAFFAAVMVAAWFGGLGPGLLATGLSVLLSWYFFLSPRYSFDLEGFGQGLRLIVFVVEGAIIGLLAESMHSSRREAETRAREFGTSELVVRARARQQAAVAELGQRALGSTDLQQLM